MVFFIVVFAIWWMPVMQHVKRRNILIILTGSFFYGCWDVRFLLLLYFTATVDFFIARAIENSGNEKTRKRLLLVSLLSNLLVLGFFKYFNFFASSFAEVLNAFGMHADFATLNIVLPVGISFYTFQALSYTIDVYRKRVTAVREWDVYYAFITFFPQMVAGPIARATQLIPQLRTIAQFTHKRASSGMRLILLGLLQKCVVADNLSVLSGNLFDSELHYNWQATLLATFAFSIQIYCDFAGYSNIARGLARLLGIELIENFRLPYSAKSLTDFWQRWHISMSTWFRDYVYIPLGGNKTAEWRVYFNLLLTFLVSGLWHGAGWCFVLWGAWHGIFLSIERLRKKTISRKMPLGFGTIWTMLIVFFGWIIFRSHSVFDAWKYFKTIFTLSDGLTVTALKTGAWSNGYFFVAIIFCYACSSWAETKAITQQSDHVLIKYRAGRWTAYWTCLLLIFLLGVYQAPPAFIYFQF